MGFNNSGIKKTSLGVTKEILFNVGLQASVGCIVPKDFGTTVSTRNIAKAGTPIHVDLMDLQSPVTKPVAAADETAVQMNAVLLHDVDTTDGAGNGTALIFGFVNINRVDADVKTAIEAVIEGASEKLTFIKGE